MNEVRSVTPGIVRRIFSIERRKISPPAAALHALQNTRRRVLQGHVDVGTNLFVGRDGFEQPAGDLVGIGVKKPHPAQFFDPRQLFQQKRQAVFQAEILAVAGRVLADQRDFAHARPRQALGLGDDRLKSPRPELAAQLRNDAERCRDDRSLPQS